MLGWDRAHRTWRATAWWAGGSLNSSLHGVNIDSDTPAWDVTGWITADNHFSCCTNSLHFLFEKSEKVVGVIARGRDVVSRSLGPAVNLLLVEDKTAQCSLVTPHYGSSCNAFKSATVVAAVLRSSCRSSRRIARHSASSQGHSGRCWTFTVRSSANWSADWSAMLVRVYVNTWNKSSTLASSGTRPNELSVMARVSASPSCTDRYARYEWA